jgi:hypothetical protein
VLTPGDRLPAVLRQGLEAGRHCLQRRRARLLGLAPASLARRELECGGRPVGQAAPKAAADADHVGELAGLKAQQEGIERVTRISVVVDTYGIQKANAGELWGARHPRFAFLWLPTYCPRANPLESICCTVL